MTRQPSLIASHGDIRLRHRLGVLAYLLGLVSQVLFALFLRAVAHSFRRPGLAAAALTYLICYGVFVLGSVAASFFTDMAAGAFAKPVEAEGVVLLILVVQGLFALALFVFYLVLIGMTRSAVLGGVAGRGRS